jgi:hypothetical protein
MDNNNILFTRNTTTNIITAVNTVNGNTMITNTNNLKNLFDVNINNPLNNQALVYNNGTTKWENKTLSFDGSSLNDVLLSNPQETDFIKWNPTNGRFINRPLQYFSANVSGKINNALFPNALYSQINSVMVISNQAHEISISANFILPAPTTLPDGYTVKLSFSGAYNGITPNDTNFTLSIQEL